MQPEAPDRPFKTLAQSARERRDIVSGETMAEARLIRFVVGPDDNVVPDLARKLPGRGIWVAANRLSVETAARKNLFSRSAKQKLSAPADLADLVEQRLVRRVLDGLGMARRAGDLVSGFEKVMATVRGGKAAWLVEAIDGSADGRGKLLALARHMRPEPRILGLFTSTELGLALGAENVIHSAFLAGRSAGSWTQEVERLTGFRPLLPESWREER